MQKWLFLFSMISLYVCVANAWAQDSGQVVVPLSDEYIREWLVLGPFFPDDLDGDFLADVGGEANIDPKEGDTVTTADGKPLTWKRYKSEEDIIDLLDAVGEYEYATAYAFCILQSQVAGDAGIYLGSDDGVAVWINGNRVHHKDPGRRALSLDEDVFEANLKAGANRCLVKVSQEVGGWRFAVRMEMLSADRAVISGIIVDEEGKPIPNVHVRLEREGEEIARAQTDTSGRYWLGVHPARGMYDFSATSGDLGAWRLDIRLREGERRTMNLTLKEAISIEGRLLMLDDKTPHMAVAVQAVMLRRGEPRVRPIATILSDEEGKYRFINLKPGRYQVRCQVLNGYVYYEKGGNGRKWKYEEVRRRGSEEAGKRVSEEVSEWMGEETQDELASPSLTHSPAYPLTRPSSLGDILRVEAGKILKNINFRFASFKKGTWRNYDTLDGLVHNAIRRIYRDPDGVMWFATDGGGVSRYDGKEFANFTTHDGLAYNLVWDIYCDPDGIMWFATNSGGVSRYDGKEFVNFTTKDGLVSDKVHAIHCDPDGVMWFGAWDGGVSRYDGSGDSPHFINFTTEDGLVGKDVISIDSDPDGVLWFGTTKGVSRYDGKGFVNFTTKDGLAQGDVYATYCDPDGVMWFGTSGGGVSRYDGKSDFPHFVNFTTEDGLADNKVWDIYCDPDGIMWFGTSGGVSRYDGKGFVNFTKADGLAHNIVNTIHRDPDGVMWFGTGWAELHQRGGVCRYDGETFLNFTKKDGLVHNEVWEICGGPDGTMWLGMWVYGGGVIRYDGREFVNFTTKDGLASDRVVRIYRDADGTMWFGTNRGVSRCDGRSVTVAMGDFPHLADEYVNAMYRDSSGVMWFGTTSGVFRYDGEELVNFRKKDGLVDNIVLAIHRDPHGVMWFGTFGIYGGGGLSRYDGKEFINFTTEDGLAGNSVWDIHSDPDGVMWFATWGGVSRYDGKEFVNLTEKDGLASNLIAAIHRDPEGGMWFGTDGGGVSYYDGITWTSLDTRDGLAGNSVSSIYQDPGGYLWFATNGGLTRYRRNTTPPKVHIVSVTTDQTYSDLSTIPAFAIGTRVTIEYDALDFKTIPEKQQYRCRVYEARGDEGNERAPSFPRSPASSPPRLLASSLPPRPTPPYFPPTKGASFDWTSKKPGTYVFEVQAIDRDLNYSEPASLDLTILPPPFYTSAGFIAGSIFSAFLIPTIIYALLLVRQKRGQVFEIIPNPYIVGNPIRSKDMFFGREDDFQFIRDKLVGSPTGLIIVLAGERRSGKTSILYQILNGRLGERFVPVFVDMQAMAVQDDAEFFQQLAQETNRSVSKSPLAPLYERGESRADLSQREESGSAGILPAKSVARASLPMVEDYHFRAEGHPAQTFQRYVDDLMLAIPEHTLLFLIDEYELLEAKVTEGTLSGESITFLAGLLERHSRIAFLFTGSRHLEERKASFWRVLLGKSIARHVSFLSESDTYRLIQEPVKGQVQYARGVMESMYRLTAGQPFYTQVVCQNMIDHLNAEERNIVGQNDVVAVAREIEDNPLPQMLYFWDSFTQEQQWALSMLAELQEQPDQVVQATDILRTVKEYELPMSLSEADWRGALEGLCRREIVQRVSEHGEYRFRIDLFRPWVRHQRSIWEAQEVERET